MFEFEFKVFLPVPNSSVVSDACARLSEPVDEGRWSTAEGAGADDAGIIWAGRTGNVEG